MKYFSRITLLLSISLITYNVIGQSHGWTINPADYSHSGEVTAIVFTGAAEVTTGTLGAFVNGICRGFNDGVFFPLTGKTVFTVICYSNVVSGETLVFKYFNPTDNSIYDINETTQFEADMVKGNAMSPLEFHIALCEPVTINSQPSGAGMCALTGNASFTVAAGGTAPFAYQWEFFNGTTWGNVTNGTPAGAAYTNATTETLSVSGITIAGDYQYRCYITNCSGNSNATSNSATLTVNEVPATPTVSLTQPTCEIATGQITVTAPLETGMTYSIDGSTYTNNTGVFDLLTPGTYTVTVKSTAGCISAGTVATINPQPPTPTPPVVGSITQPTCEVSTGSVVLTGLPSGSWTLIRTPGSVEAGGSGTSTTVSGIPSGTYTFTVTNSDGCTSSPSDDVVINAQPPTPAPPVASTITQPTCDVATGSVVLSGLPSSGIWTITRNPGGETTTGTGVSATISDLPTATYTFTVTNAETCTSGPSAVVDINAQPPSPATPVESVDCSLGFGNAVVTVTSPTGTGLEYSLDGGIYQPGTTFTGVANGSHTITVRNSSGCTSTGISFDVSCGCVNPPTVTLSSTSGSTCSTEAITVSGNIFGGSATGVTITQNGAGTVNPSSSGTSPFSFTYTPAAGDAGNTVTITVITNNPLGEPCAVATATYTLTVNATPTPPAVGAITHPTCAVSTGSVILNGLPASGTWTITRSPGGVTTTGSGTSATISGLETGSFTFTVTNAAGCTSGSSANVVINAQPPTPTTPVVGTITPPTCTVSTGSVALSGLPSTGTWNITRTPGGVTNTGTGTSTTISSIPSGAYTFTVTNADGCTSASSNNVVISEQPPTPSAPVVGTITPPSCTLSTGSLVLSGLPGSGAWTLTRYPGTITAIGSGTSTTVSGLGTGTHNFTITNEAGCTSPLSSNVVIPSQPPSPATPVESVDCSLGFGNAIVTVTSPTGAGLEYRLDAGQYQSGTIFAGVANGSHTITVRNSSGCTTTGSSFDVSCGCVNPPTVTLSSTSGSTCSSEAITISGNAFGGSATGVTITENGAGTVNPSSSGTSPFSFTYTPAAGDAGNTVTITVITNNPLGEPCAAATATYTLTVNATPTPPAVGTITHPTCTVSTGSVILNGLPSSGTWTITRSPGGVITTGTGVSATISDIPSGTYNFTVTNLAGCTSLGSANVVLNAQPASPVSPVSSVDCSLGFGNAVVTVTSPTGAGFEYSLDGGIYQPGTTFTGVANGSHTITVRNSSGCTATGSSFDVSCGCVNPPTVTLSNTSGSTCGTEAITVSGNTFGGSATGVTITENGAGTVSPSSPGTSPFSFTYTPAAGDAGNTVTITVITNNPLGEPCTVATATYTLTVNATPTPPAVGTITHPTCTVSTGSVILSGLPSSGTWTITRSPGGVATTGSGTSTTLSGLETGSYTFTVTNAAGCASGSSANVVINAQPPAPAAPVVGTITPPTCTVSTGSVALSGLPSTGTWSITRTPGGVITTGTGTSTTIPTIPSGTYVFMVTNAAGCTSASSNNAVIPEQPPTPSAPVVGTITPPNCTLSTGSVVLSGLPASGNWILTRYPGTITSNGTGTSTTVSGLASGNYNFTVTNNAGCTSSLSTNVEIPTQPASPVSPVSSVDCSLGFGNAVVTVTSPTGAGLEYRLDAGTYQSGTIFAGVANGSHTITVRNSSGCSATGNSFDVSCGCANPPTVTLSSTSGSTCSTEAITVSGNTFGGSATGVTITENGAGTASPSSPGTSPFSFTYTPAAGDAGNTVIITVTTNNPLGAPCAATSTTFNLTVNATPSAPSIGTITHPTCTVSTGSVILNGLPASGNWTIARSPGGVTNTGTGTTASISGLETGSYTFRVTSAAGCTSGSSANVVINAQPPAPAPPVVGTITQPTCNVSTGSVALSGLPSTGTWTITRTPGGATKTGTGTTNTVSGIPAGNYTFTVTNAAGCISVASSNVVINPQPPAPDAPVTGTITQPTCELNTGSIVLSGLPATGTWTLTRLPGSEITTGTGTSTTISGLAPGTYTFTVANSFGCTSSSSSDIVINTPPQAPDTPVVGTITPPTCTISTGSVLLSGLPAAGTWIVTRNPGGVTKTGTGTSTTVSGINSGTYSFVVTNAEGCVSGSSASVVIPEQPPTPLAPIVGAITPPTCITPSGSVVLSGLPETGSWILTRYPGTVTTSGSGATADLSGLPTGTYNFTVTSDAGCVSVPSDNVVIPSPPPVPPAPVVGTITQPACDVATGSVMLNGLPSTGTWTLTRSPGAVTITGAGTSRTITGLPSGTYTFTVSNADGCISASSSNVIINTQPPRPSAPVVGTITQPTCILATGSVLLTGLPASGTWILTRNPGAVTTSGTGTSTTITGLPEGTYTFTVANATGCISVASANVLINSQPPSPASPMQTIDCSLGSGNAIVTVTSPTGEGLEYRLNGGIYQTGTAFANIANGNHTITVRNSLGCVTTGPVFSVSCGCANPPLVTLSSISGTTCGTAPVTITGNTFGGSASSVTITENGAGAVSPVSASSSPFSFTYTPVASDAGKTIIITVTTNNPLGGPCTPATATYALLVNPIPSAPSIGTRFQPTCTVATGRVTLNGLPSTGTWILTRNPGGVISNGTGTSTNVTGLEPGTYTFTVTNAVGCTSSSSANVVIDPLPPIPAPPVLGEITHPTCALFTGSVVLNDLPSSGVWTVTRNPGSVTKTGTGATNTISALPEGTYTFMVTNSFGCTSESSEELVINPQPQIPTEPSVGNITPPTCTLETGSVALLGLPATGTWTLTGYPGTVVSTGSGTSTTISELVTGTYNYTVTNEAGCVSVLSANIVIPAQPPVPEVPVVGAITHPTFEVPSGSVVLSGLPSGTWTMVRYPGEVTTTGSGTTIIITDLQAGVFTFTVTNSSGCTSMPSSQVIISTPGIPVLIINNPEAVCAPETVDLTSTDITEGSTPGLIYTYWFDLDALVPFETPETAVADTYYIQGTTVSGFFDIKPVVVKVYEPPVPQPGPEQVLDYRFETFMNATLGENETGVWSRIAGSGIVLNEIDPKTLINQLILGDNVFRWTVTNGICPEASDFVTLRVRDLIIPTLITPNMDGKNDYFVISGLETLGITELIIFDRRGMQVYKNQSYQNDWEGVDYNNNPLPDDTYFYILKPQNGISMSGYVVIRR